jgi:hypothetical protein
MRIILQNRKFIAWVACAAILLGSLAPTISHAMAKVQGKDAPWAQICSTSGLKYIPLDLGQNSQGSDTPESMTMNHCAYCLAHAGSFAIFADIHSPLMAVKLHNEYPPLFYHSPRKSFVWAPSNPRGPPSFS